jgi:glycosyltransferase involved in cell wall biosynthesis
LDDLSRCLQEIDDNPARFAGLKAAALERARTFYSWESVIDQYEQLLLKLAAPSAKRITG